jgi:hypothetical protein
MSWLIHPGNPADRHPFGTSFVDPPAHYMMEKPKGTGSYLSGHEVILAPYLNFDELF